MIEQSNAYARNEGYKKQDLGGTKVSQHRQTGMVEDYNGLQSFRTKVSKKQKKANIAKIMLETKTSNKIK